MFRDNYFVEHLQTADARSEWNNRSSRPQVFCKKDVLTNFLKFTGKHLFQSLVFNKVAGLRQVKHARKCFLELEHQINIRKFDRENKRKYNTRIYNLISIPQITRLLLRDEIISRKTDPRGGSKKGNRSHGMLEIIKLCQ